MVSLLSDDCDSWSACNDDWFWVDSLLLPMQNIVERDCLRKYEHLKYVRLCVNEEIGRLGLGYKFQ